jgi:hypothetical protein
MCVRSQLQFLFLPVLCYSFAQSLTQLRLNNNTGISGTIPRDLGLLPGLERLDLLDTSMRGDIPCWLEQKHDNKLPPPLLQDKQQWIVGLL